MAESIFELQHHDEARALFGFRDENLRRAWLTSPKRREVALAHDRMLLDAFERRDSDMARSIATVRVDTREQWIENLRSGSTERRAWVRITHSAISQEMVAPSWNSEFIHG